MPVIEFVNHIELLAVDYGKVWRGENVSLALLFGNAKRIDALQVAALSRLALSERESVFFFSLFPLPKKTSAAAIFKNTPQP